MKKLIATFMVSACLICGGVFAINTQTNNSSNDDVKYIGAGGEKEPGLFSNYSTYSVKAL